MMLQAQRRWLVYKCTTGMCGQLFLTGSSLKRHQTNDHGSSLEWKITFCCSVCDQEYETLSALETHAVQHYHAGEIGKVKQLNLEYSGCGKHNTQSRTNEKKAPVQHAKLEKRDAGCINLSHSLQDKAHEASKSLLKSTISMKNTVKSVQIASNNKSNYTEITQSRMESISKKEPISIIAKFATDGRMPDLRQTPAICSTTQSSKTFPFVKTSLTLSTLEPKQVSANSILMCLPENAFPVEGEVKANSSTRIKPTIQKGSSETEDVLQTCQNAIKNDRNATKKQSNRLTTACSNGQVLSRKKYKTGKKRAFTGEKVASAVFVISSAKQLDALGDQGMFVCRVCGKVFVSSARITEHLEEHPKCNLCFKIFSNEKDAFEHLCPVSKTSEKEKDFTGISQGSCDKNVSNHNKTVSCISTNPTGTSDILSLNEDNPMHSIPDAQKPVMCLEDDLPHLHAKVGTSVTTASLNQFSHNSVVKTCPACSATFCSSKELFKHTLSHKPLQFFQCTACENFFTSHGSFTDHLSQCEMQQNRNPYDTCKQSFEGLLKDVQVNKQSHHFLDNSSVSQSFTCPECGQAFDVQTVYVNHLIKHAVQQKQSSPKLCLESFHSSLKRRMKSFKSNSPKSCSLCNEMFESKRALVSHQKKHIYCMFCCKNFDNRTELELHNRMAHRIERPWTCDLCNASYRSKFDLTRHVLKHKGKKFYVCHTCGRDFYASTDLKQHEASVHSSLPRSKPYMCSHCGKQFFTRGHLNTHERSHSCLQLFECPHCPVHCKTSKNLEIHIRHHTGELPIKCKVCGEGFVDYCYLGRHMARHKAAPDLLCHVCSKAFFQLQHLKQHLVGCHFLCFDCEAHLQDKKAMKQHQKECPSSGAGLYLKRLNTARDSSVVVEPVNFGGNSLESNMVDGANGFADRLTTEMVAPGIEGLGSESLGHFDENTNTIILYEDQLKKAQDAIKKKSSNILEITIPHTYNDEVTRLFIEDQTDITENTVYKVSTKSLALKTTFLNNDFHSKEPLQLHDSSSALDCFVNKNSTTSQNAPTVNVTLAKENFDELQIVCFEENSRVQINTKSMDSTILLQEKLQAPQLGTHTDTERDEITASGTPVQDNAVTQEIIHLQENIPTYSNCQIHTNISACDSSVMEENISLQNISDTNSHCVTEDASEIIDNTSNLSSRKSIINTYRHNLMTFDPPFSLANSLTDITGTVDMLSSLNNGIMDRTTTEEFSHRKNSAVTVEKIKDHSTEDTNQNQCDINQILPEQCDPNQILSEERDPNQFLHKQSDPNQVLSEQCDPNQKVLPEQSDPNHVLSEQCGLNQKILSEQCDPNQKVLPEHYGLNQVLSEHCDPNQKVLSEHYDPNQKVLLEQCDPNQVLIEQCGLNQKILSEQCNSNQKILPDQCDSNHILSEQRDPNHVLPEQCNSNQKILSEQCDPDQMFFPEQWDPESDVAKFQPVSENRDSKTKVTIATRCFTKAELSEESELSVTSKALQTSLSAGPCEHIEDSVNSLAGNTAVVTNCSSVGCDLTFLDAHETFSAFRNIDAAKTAFTSYILPSLQDTAVASQADTAFSCDTAGTCNTTETILSGSSKSEPVTSSGPYVLHLTNTQSVSTQLSEPLMVEKCDNKVDFSSRTSKNIASVLISVPTDSTRSRMLTESVPASLCVNNRIAPCVPKVSRNSGLTTSRESQSATGYKIPIVAVYESTKAKVTANLQKPPDSSCCNENDNTKCESGDEQCSLIDNSHSPMTWVSDLVSVKRATDQAGFEGTDPSESVINIRNREKNCPASIVQNAAGLNGISIRESMTHQSVILPDENNAVEKKVIDLATIPDHQSLSSSHQTVVQSSRKQHPESALKLSIQSSLQVRAEEGLGRRVAKPRKCVGEKAAAEPTAFPMITVVDGKAISTKNFSFQPFSFSSQRTLSSSAHRNLTFQCSKNKQKLLTDGKSAAKASQYTTSAVASRCRKFSRKRHSESAPQDLCLENVFVSQQQRTRSSCSQSKKLKNQEQSAMLTGITYDRETRKKRLGGITVNRNIKKRTVVVGQDSVSSLSHAHQGISDQLTGALRRSVASQLEVNKVIVKNDSHRPKEKRLRTQRVQKRTKQLKESASFDVNEVNEIGSPQIFGLGPVDSAASQEVAEDACWQLDRPYHCDRCSGSFFHLDEIQRHLQLNHDCLEFYQCSHCIATFSSLASLTAHFHGHAQTMVSSTFSSVVSSESSVLQSSSRIKRDDAVIPPPSASSILSFTNCSLRDEITHDRLLCSSSASLQRADTGRELGFPRTESGLTLESLAEVAVAVAEKMDADRRMPCLTADVHHSISDSLLCSKFSTGKSSAQSSKTNLRISCVENHHLDQNSGLENMSSNLEPWSGFQSSGLNCKSEERPGTNEPSPVSLCDSSTTWKACYTVGGQSYTLSISVPGDSGTRLYQ